MLASNLAYHKASLFAFKKDSCMSIYENLDEFLRMTMLLDGTDYVIDSVSIVMIMMNAMPESYHVVKDAF